MEVAIDSERHDYTTRPNVSPNTLRRVTNTLARWLPSQADAEPVAEWDARAWTAAEWIVYWQGALPWLVQRLQESSAPVPEDVWQRLLALDASSRERTRRMLDELVALLEALRTEGVIAIPLKGAVLAPLYYPDPLARPLGDVDVLVRPEDVEGGVAVLRRLGYRFYSRSAEDEVFLLGERQANIWAPDNVHPLEMHYAVREEYAGLIYDLGPEIRRHSRPRPHWAGAEAHVPGPATLLHHVCAHASSDWLIQRGRLMHLQDVHHLTHHMTAADWERFRARLTPHGARFVYPALGFARKYARVPIPQGVWERLERWSPSALRAWVARIELGDTSLANSRSRAGIGLELARLLARTPGERARMWGRSLLPRRWNLSKRYPHLVRTPAWPLCYVLLNADRLRHIAGKKWRSR